MSQLPPKIFRASLWTALFIVLLTGGAFAATTAPPDSRQEMNRPGHDKNAMHHDMVMPDSSRMDADDMVNAQPAQTPEQNGPDNRDMIMPDGSPMDESEMSDDAQDEAADNSVPWPVLYGFGGLNLAVVLVAGGLKYTGLGRNGGK